MTNAQDAARDWKSQVLWLNQHLASSDLRLRLIPLETLHPLCDQIAMAVKMSTLRWPGLLQKLSGLMNQIASAMGLQIGRWQAQPDFEQLPMLCVHAQHGIGILKESHHVMLPWLIETKSGPLQLQGHESGWLFAPIKSPPADARVAHAFMQALHGTRLSRTHWAKLAGVALSVHLALLGAGWALMHHVTKPFHQLGWVELLSLSLVVSLGMLINELWVAARRRIIEPEALTAQHGLHLHTSLEHALRQLQLQVISLLAVDAPLTLGLWLAVSAYVCTEDSDVTLGTWLACTLWVTRVIHPVTQLVPLILDFFQARMSGWPLSAPSQTDGTLLPTRVRRDMKSDDLRLALSGVRHRYPGQNLGMEIPSLMIKPGERVAILGDVGSGKSTLLKLLAGTLSPDQGVVRVGQWPAQMVADAGHQLLGYMASGTGSQRGTLRQCLTVHRPGTPEEELLAVCQQVGLSPLIQTHANGLSVPMHEISDGQRQLVAMANMLLRAPRIWLLDNPLSNLDTATRSVNAQLLNDRLGFNQTLVFISQHSEMLSLAHRMVVLKSGRIIMDGGVQEIFKRLGLKPAASES
jgi:ABC-type multidrug transport system ATPase subunit